MSQPFGAWSREVAEQYAFAVGPVDPYLAAGDVGEEGLPVAFAGASVGPDGFAPDPEDQAVIDACYLEADAQRFDLVTVTSGGTAQWRVELEQVWIGWQTYPEAEAVEAEYASCLTDVGAEPNPDLWGGASGMDLRSASQPQIDLALLVVGCKEQVRYVPRLADVVAAHQAPVLETYAAELGAYRADVDLVVEAAREVLELNADVMVQG
ncbi:hypothetical protein [Antribacter gilvus]|uniref:hypothetical protein n=1 Tax=Antribacter gilvus TaxID=2304675 RepID=UPI000F767103|nr:hypothetical protein [Antribacter gilvus]